MRIISEHHDFYDGVQAQGQDQTCVWVRRLEEVYGQWHFASLEFPKYWRWGRKLDTDGVIVGFCGKIYPILQLRNTNKFESKGRFCYSMEDVDQFVKDNFKPDEVKSFMKNPRSWRKWNIGTPRSNFAKFFDNCEQHKSDYEHIFVNNGCPVFIAKYRSRIKDDCSVIYHGRKEDVDRSNEKSRIIKPVSYETSCLLKDYGFYKFFDTYTAFQEIHMYLGGVLGFGNPHVPVPDDKTMRDIKGFDNWSFKKLPSKKRK